MNHQPPICGTPDAVLFGHGKILGRGNWPNCHGRTGFHAASVWADEFSQPDFLRPLWPSVWRNVKDMYAEVALILLEAPNRSGAEITLEWVPRSNGWIGLAQLGFNLSCRDQIWAQFLATYKPGDDPGQLIRAWTILVAHEIGHNCGLQHSQGGVMNASILPTLPLTWVDDPSEHILTRLFGGEPPPDEPDPEPPTNGNDVLEKLIAQLLIWLWNWLQGDGPARLEREVAKTKREELK